MVDTAARQRLARVLAEAALPGGADAVPLPSHSSDVWALGEHVVRVCWRGDAERLRREAAITAHLPAGVACPEIVAAGGDAELSWIVARRVEGQRLDQVWPKLDDEQRRAAIAQLAGALRALHTWHPPEHVRRLLSSHAAERPETPSAIVGTDLCPLPVRRARVLAAHASELDGVAAATISHLDARFRQLADLDPYRSTPHETVVHGDLHFANVLWQDGAITAVLDFEWVRLGPPELDLEALLRGVDWSGTGEAGLVPRAEMAQAFGWLAEDYPELFARPALAQRLWLYQLACTLRELYAWPVPPVERAAANHPADHLPLFVSGDEHLRDVLPGGMCPGFDADRIVHEPPHGHDGPVARAEDLLELVDVCGLTLSPDASAVAFRTQWVDASHEGYRAEWHMAPTVSGGACVRLADAGSPVVEDGFVEGALHNGGLNPVAAWSPDGRRLAFQVHDGAGSRLREAGLDGHTTDIADLDGMLRAVRYLPDGRRLLVRTSPLIPTPVHGPRPAAGAGILLGAHSKPDCGITALAGPEEPDEPADWVVDVETGERRCATEQEAAQLDEDRVHDLDGVLFAVLSPRRELIAFVEDTEDQHLHVAPADRPAESRRVTDMPVSASWWDERNPLIWWSADGTSLYFQARNEARDLALYVVGVDDGTPRELAPAAVERYEPRVDPAHGVAVCLEAAPARPPEVVAIDLRDGGRRTLTDLNPRWREMRCGRVRRIEATNDYGDRTWANLVYPPDYRPGSRYPMVVTTYLSYGFLRGATGDEYPIHPLAAHGFLVLDLTRPHSYEIDDPGPEHDPADRFEALYKDFDGPLSTMRVMIDGLAREGVLDRDRVGVCGLSNGTDIATFALESSGLFRAAVLSGFSHDDEFSYQLLGPGYEPRWRDWGMDGGPAGPGGHRWRRRSPGIGDITAAILSHDSETEYLAGMSAYGQLVRAGKPVEAHVYPREDHVKTWPRHRLEIYRRTIDWFDFWLRDARDPDPAKHEQYQRWLALRGNDSEDAGGVSRET